MKENNNNDINAKNLDHEKDDKIISMQIKNNDKGGFFGTSSAFKNLVDEIKSISTKPLGELFEKKHKINGKTSTLKVTYKRSQNSDNEAYKETRDKSDPGVKAVDIFLPVVLDEKIEQSIEECEKYNKMMWKKYLNTITEQDKSSQIYTKYRDQFEDRNIKPKNSDECKPIFLDEEIEQSIEECDLNTITEQDKSSQIYTKYRDQFEDRNIKPKNSDECKPIAVGGKTATVIFFCTLMVFAIAYLGLYIFAPGLLIPCAATFGISAVLAAKITGIVSIFAFIAVLICFVLVRRISAELKKCKEHNQKVNEAANLLEVQKYKYTVENFKYQCEFYSALIDKFIDERHLMPPKKKRAASIFFYTLAALVIVFLCFGIFAPGLLIPFIVQFGALFGITTEIASQIVCYFCSFAPIIAFIFFRLGKYISWKQNDYEEDTNHELYSKYNQKLKQCKIGRVGLTGEKCKIGEYENNYDEKEAQDCPLFKYYHQQVQKEDENKKKCLVWELKSNTKTPIELLLKLKKAYEIPEQFKNTESKAFGVKSK